MNPDIRVGFGYDVHRLKEGRDMILGGVRINHPKGLLGHSDADVLIHAVCDALLGAANMQDIGYHFSDKDPAYRNIDSKILLLRVMEMLRTENYDIGNIDATIAMEVPKIAPHIAEMKSTLSEIMMIDKTRISIKATTTERLGFEGREEGVSAYAIVLIHKK